LCVSTVFPSASTAFLTFPFALHDALPISSTGLVVGLVAITPGAGFVPVWSSFIVGFLVSPICYFGVALVKKKLKIDDALDAFGRSEEHTSELQSRFDLVCLLLLETKKKVT